MLLTSIVGMAIPEVEKEEVDAEVPPVYSVDPNRMVPQPWTVVSPLTLNPFVSLARLINPNESAKTAKKPTK